MGGIFKVFSIHVFMGGISLLLYLITLTNFSHLQAIITSLVLFFLNLVGYLFLSFNFLKVLDKKEVIISTFFFLTIGLLLWVVHLTTDDFGSFYFLYHMAGYSSFIWFVYSFTDMNEMLYEKLGFMFSLVPSILILIGFYVGKTIKRMH